MAQKVKIGKLHLKKVKVMEELSEETYCFHAELWFGNQKLGTVSNGGYGGPNDFRPDDWSKQKTIVEQIESLYKEPLDFVISDLLGDYLKEKEEKRINKWVERHKPSGLVYKDGNSYNFLPYVTSKGIKHTYIQLERYVRSKYPNAIILN